MSRWDSWDYEELVNILSDYHKDVFGCRLRMNGESREVVIKELDRIDRYMDHLRSTPEGRAQLRQDGWDVKEPV